MHKYVSFWVFFLIFQASEMTSSESVIQGSVRLEVARDFPSFLRCLFSHQTEERKGENSQKVNLAATCCWWEAIDRWREKERERDG